MLQPGQSVLQDAEAGGVQAQAAHVWGLPALYKSPPGPQTALLLGMVIPSKQHALAWLPRQAAEEPMCSFMSCAPMHACFATGTAGCNGWQAFLAQQVFNP